MLNKFKHLLVFLLFTLFTGMMFFGCSSEKTSLIDREKMDKYVKGGGYSFVYVLAEKDFESLKKELEAGKDTVKTIEKYTPVTELAVGESYYAVGYTVAENNVSKPIKFEKGSGFYVSNEKNGELYGFDIFTTAGYISVNRAQPVVSNIGESSEKNSYVYHGVTLSDTYTGKKVELCTYLYFTPRSDMRLNITYGVNASVSGDRFGDGYVSEVVLDSCYEKKVDLIDMSVSYLAKADYNGGRYDEASLQSTLDMSANETYYMVIRGKLKPRFSQNTGEVATLGVTFPLAERVSATIDSASSGTYTEKLYDNEKLIRINIKLPENAEEEKDFELIVKLIPKVSQKVYVDIAFFSSNEISVVGEKRVVDVIFEVK